MLEQGIMPDNITYVGIFGGCEISQDIGEALRFHAGFSSIRVVLEADVAVRIALVNLYGKCGRLAEARSLFDMIPKHSPVSWNAMISVYAQQGEFEESLSLVMSMLQGSPVFDEALLITALGVCANSPFHVHGRLIHGLVVKLGYDVSTEVGTAIIDMYGKFGNLEEARSCFLRLNVHNVMEWNAFIGAYIRNGCYTEAIELFHTMQEDNVRLDTVTFVTILGAFSGSLEPAGSRLTALHGIIVGHGFEPTVDTGTALISMYGKNGNLERACIMFAKLPTRCLISWNSMMTAFAQHGLGQEVFRLFIQMLGEGLQPDGVTMLVVLSACSHMGLIKESQRFFTSMLCHYESEPKLEHFGCLVDLYGRLGKVDEAKRLIYGMHLEDHVFFWQILLGACKLYIIIWKLESMQCEMQWSWILVIQHLISCYLIYI
jgi:pentatricopeptide repeat protein